MMRYLKARPELLRFLKFSSVGVANTAIDFSVLNALLFLVGTHGSSVVYAFFKAAAFIAAVCASYAMNSMWVFRESRRNPGAGRGAMFLAVSAAGFFLNVGISTIAFAIGKAAYPDHILLASNIAAVTGTLIVLAFNFFGYKHLVFRTVAPQP